MMTGCFDRYYLDIETIPLEPNRRAFLAPTLDDVPMGNTKDPAKIQARWEEYLKAWEDGEGCALDSLQARIALIGYARDDGGVKHIICATGDGDGTRSDQLEREGLTEFWEMLKGDYNDGCGGSYNPLVRIICDNVRFDATMLIHRSFLLDVKVPIYLIDDLRQYRPKHWVCLMDFWRLGDSKAKYRKLAHLCGAFGIPVKQSPVTGKDFHVWWKKDTAACLEYNRQDVEAIRELARRLPV